MNKYIALIKAKSLNPNWNEADHEWAARMIKLIEEGKNEN